MQKKLITTVLALIMVAPGITNAVENSNATNTQKETVREKIRTEIQNKLQNIKNNQEVRNSILDERREIASSTKNNIKNINIETRNELKNASTTSEKKNIRQEMRLDIFKAQQGKIVKETAVALNNLKQIRQRIDSRITKAEQSGRNMTNARKLLVTADDKIKNAEQAMNQLASFMSTIKASSSTEKTHINTEKLKEINSTVNKAIKDAREALNAVIVAIAHDMGLKLGISSTTPVINTASSTNP